jgi:hypothetical protein
MTAVFRISTLRHVSLYVQTQADALEKLCCRYETLASLHLVALRNLEMQKRLPGPWASGPHLRFVQGSSHLFALA